MPALVKKWKRYCAEHAPSVIALKDISDGSTAEDLSAWKKEAKEADKNRQGDNSSMDIYSVHTDDRMSLAVVRIVQR